MEGNNNLNRFVLFPIIILILYIGLFFVQIRYLYMYYVFDWVCNNGIVFFYVFAFLSCLIAVLGLKIAPFITFLGFIWGELLGQLLGKSFLSNINIGWFIFIVTYVFIYFISVFIELHVKKKRKNN